MFRMTDWFIRGHEFGGWKRHFSERGIQTQVRSCEHKMVALFREGTEIVVPDEDLSPFELSRKRYEARYGCECGWSFGWETRKGRRPGIAAKRF